MLIVPAGSRPDWRRPPLVTLLLILINCLVYFGVQSGDARRSDRAYQFYGQSTLPRSELPRYVRYLQANGEQKKATAAAARLAAKRWLPVLHAMQADSLFMPRLRGGKVIAAADPAYAGWRAQRDEFDRLYGSNAVDRFGFRPAAPTWPAAFGHLFLHASADHLFANMAILFVVGYLVEEALGKTRYLACYLLAGLGAAGFDLVFNATRLIAGIGASGAISGVMAMFVVLCGLRRVRFFYWLVFRFDFFRAPAIVVLPWWLGNELYQYFVNHGNAVNYLAHFGGFVTGALLIAALRAASRAPIELPDDESDEESEVDPVPAALAAIENDLGAQRFEAARKALRQLASAHRGNLVVVGRYYEVARKAPASEDFHHAAALIFALPKAQPGSGELIYETFVDYLENARPSVRFSVRQLITLTRRLARAGHADDAERLLRVLALRSPQDTHLPGLLLLVADAFRRAGDGARHEQTLARLRSQFPASDEARGTAAAALH